MNPNPPNPPLIDQDGVEHEIPYNDFVAKNIFFGVPYAFISYKNREYFCMKWAKNFVPKEEHKRQKRDGQNPRTQTPNHVIPTPYQMDTAEPPGNIGSRGCSEKKIKGWKSTGDFEDEQEDLVKNKRQRKRAQEKANKKQRNGGLLRTPEQQAQRTAQSWINNQCLECGKKCLRKQAVVAWRCLSAASPDNGGAGPLIRVHYLCGAAEDTGFIYPCPICQGLIEITSEQIKKLRLPRV